MVELGLQPKQCHHIFSSNSAGGVSESHKYPIQDRQLDTQELVHLKPLLLRLKAYEITSDGKLQDKYLDKKKKKIKGKWWGDIILIWRSRQKSDWAVEKTEDKTRCRKLASGAMVSLINLSKSRHKIFFLSLPNIVLAKLAK